MSANAPFNAEHSCNLSLANGVLSLLISIALVEAQIESHTGQERGDSNACVVANELGILGNRAESSSASLKIGVGLMVLTTKQR